MSEASDETEIEFLDEVFSDLNSDLSDEHNVIREFAIKPGIRSDGVVTDSEGKPLVVIEAKIKTGARYQEQAIQQLRTYLQASEAEYGLFVSPDVRYLFSLHGEDPVLEASHSSLSSIINVTDQRRAFISYEELAFCYDRARKQAKKFSSNEATIENVILELQRITTGERHNIVIDPLESLSNSIQNIDDILQDKYPFYQFESQKQSTLTDFASETKTVPAFTRAIQGVFRGYSIVETDTEILHEFTHHLTSRAGDQKYSTPLNVAQYLVDLADIGPDQLILDPACGWGNLLRGAEREGAEGVGIDIDKDALITASGFNSLLDLDIEFHHDNGLRLPFDKFRNTFDHVLLDPPIRSKTKEEDLPEELANYAGRDIAQAFVIASLEALQEGGTLTAVVPVSLLTGANNREFRKELLDDYNIRRVVEVADGSLSPALGADLAVLQVEKQRHGIEQTEFVIIDKFEGDRLDNDPDILEQRSLDLSNQNLLGDDTLAPSEVLRIDEITEDLTHHYPETASLSGLREIREILKGARVPDENLKPEGALPYLKISHATKEQPRLRYTENTENYPIAGPSDLLISATGTVSITYVPDKQLVPDQNWAIARFDSREAAITYDGFFKTELGKKLLKAIATGQSIPYTPLYRFRQLPVPIFEENQLSSISDRLEAVNYDGSKVDEATAQRITDIFAEEVRE